MSIPIVYLIDDEPDVLQLLSDTAKMLGFKTKNYNKASDFFDDNQATEINSILILDLRMPEMDGIQVMRKLSKMAHPPKLILSSGQDLGILSAAEKLGQARNLDIVAVLHKPFKISFLQKILKQNISEIHEKQSYNTTDKTQVFTPDGLLTAIQNNQLVLHFQPQININSGTYIGVEALVRWQHPEHGLIFPDSFIEIAEKNGLIGSLTSRVIGLAVEQRQVWQQNNLKPGISVNISAENITSLTLPEQLEMLLKSKQIDPGMLTLEVTESALISELTTSLDILTRMRLKGLRLSIDDFGTGYSSLSQLHRVPFTELKIDRSFVMKMSEDEQALGIVKTCIMLGHELNMQVVAEGVETAEHLEILKQLNCDIAQGYFISRPAPPEEITKILKTKRFEQSGGQVLNEI